MKSSNRELNATIVSHNQCTASMWCQEYNHILSVACIASFIVCIHDVEIGVLSTVYIFPFLHPLSLSLSLSQSYMCTHTTIQNSLSPSRKAKAESEV